MLQQRAFDRGREAHLRLHVLRRRAEHGVTVRDVTVLARDADHIRAVAAAADQLESVEVEHVSDRTFLLHLGGKIEVTLKAPIALTGVAN